jgi:molecular chaperone HtpG
MARQAADAASAPGAEERHDFQAEVSRLLDLMIHSVYSEKEVFLRELISNAADACDKLRYEAITTPELVADDPHFRVTVTLDAAARQIAVADNGIGMAHDELVANLGTIARSGTRAFAEALRQGQEGKADVALIGQFGVGFYAAFMVAERVEVISRKAGSEQSWRWVSDGSGTFSVAPVTGEEADAALISRRGTTVRLALRPDEDDFLSPHRLKTIIKTYSDHIGLPIEFIEVKEGAPGNAEVVNAASALWMLPRKEVTEEQYREFYRHIGHAFDAPWLTLHYTAEGKLAYHVLLFVPTSRPLDLFDPARQGRVRLYVKRVYITDNAELLPSYLRFVRGVIDSEDMPLNLSREMLQNNPVVARIRGAVTKRLLSELKKKVEKAPEDYASFWSNFGAVLKEGIYEDAERREELLELARFRTTRSDEGWRSLADYVAGMRPHQTAIYYITGEQAAVERSPQLEGYRARDIEVLLLTDPVDDFWIAAVEGFQGKPFRSVTRGAADLEAIAPAADQAEPAASDAALGTLIALLKQTLGDAVKEVRRSERLTDSPVCLVADESGLDLHLERMLAQHGQLAAARLRILEINPRHPLIRSLAEKAKEGVRPELEEAAFLLLDQARIIEGETPSDPSAFSRRMAAVLARSLAA